MFVKCSRMHWTDVTFILTFHEQSINIGALPRWVSKVVFRLLCHIHGESHLVQRPLILAGDALQYGWEKKPSMYVNTSGAHTIEYIFSVRSETVTSPVRKDWGLKRPESQTTAGSTKSWVQLSNSRQLLIRSVNLENLQDMLTLAQCLSLHN